MGGTTIIHSYLCTPQSDQFIVLCISFHIYPVLSLSPWKHLSPSRHYSLHDKEVWPRDTGGNFRQTLGLDLIYTDALEPNSDDVADT